MIPTAEDYLKRERFVVGKSDEDIMIEFTKMHCEEQAKVIYKQARIIDDPNSYTGNTGSEYPPDQIISKESILNAYPLTNIK